MLWPPRSPLTSARQGRIRAENARNHRGLRSLKIIEKLRYPSDLFTALNCTGTGFLCASGQWLSKMTVSEARRPAGVTMFSSRKTAAQVQAVLATVERGPRFLGKPAHTPACSAPTIPTSVLPLPTVIILPSRDESSEAGCYRLGSGQSVHPIRAGRFRLRITDASATKNCKPVGVLSPPRSRQSTSDGGCRRS